MYVLCFQRGVVLEREGGLIKSRSVELPSEYTPAFAPFFGFAG